MGNDERSRCARCGSDVSAGRFCANCGAAVDTDPGAPDVAVPLPAAGRPSGFVRSMRWVARWRSPIVIVPLLGALLVSGGMGARMLLAEVPEKAKAGPSITCWDGTEAPAEAGCDLPTGRDGLRHVFPSFRPDRDTCRDVLVEHPDLPRPTMWECDAEVGGEPVLITYSELTGVEDGLRFLEREYAGSEREGVLGRGGGGIYRYVWRRALGVEGFDLASSYVDFPYAVTVAADNSLHRDRALSTLVDFRWPGEIAVRPEPADQSGKADQTGKKTTNALP